MATRRLLTPHAIFAPPSFTGSGIMHSIHGDTRAVPTMRRLRSLVKVALLGSAYTPERHCQSCLTQLPAFLSRLPEMVTRRRRRFLRLSPPVPALPHAARRCPPERKSSGIGRIAQASDAPSLAYSDGAAQARASRMVRFATDCVGLAHSTPPPQGGEGGDGGPSFPLTTFARARTGTYGKLPTHRHPGHPFGSVASITARHRGAALRPGRSRPLAPSGGRDWAAGRAKP